MRVIYHIISWLIKRTQRSLAQQRRIVAPCSFAEVLPKTGDARVEGRRLLSDNDVAPWKRLRVQRGERLRAFR